jgi:hypothetical protein
MSGSETPLAVCVWAEPQLDDDRRISAAHAARESFAIGETRVGVYGIRASLGLLVLCIDAGKLR